jgi:hypothetical protein
LGIIFLISIFFFKKDGEGKAVFNVICFNFEIPIKRTFIFRCLVVVLALLSFAYPAFRDYSQFFPTTYQMEAFFDDDGISKSLARFSQEEVTSLGILTDWPEKKRQYFKRINEIVTQQLGIPGFFSSKSEYIYSKGETKFVVEKVQGTWQQYYIKEAWGDLAHFVEQPGRKPATFKSKFKLLRSGGDHISVSIADIYLHFSKILKPQFQQYAVLAATPKSERILYDHCLYAVTKIRFFPVNDIGNTIYCINIGTSQNQRLVPIGYCVYIPK